MRLMAVLLLLVACGNVPVIKEEIPQEINFCAYETNGMCVFEDYEWSMDTDPIIMSWMLGLLEYEVNFYYPGLDFTALAEEHGLVLNYKWATRGIEYQGNYSDSEVMARVYLRNGEGITPLMACMDRYYVAAHEILHFIADRYLSWEYNLEDEWPFMAHNVDYIFRDWAMKTGVPLSYAVEGRLYVLIHQKCLGS